MAKMTRNARFQRGSGCYTCRVCRRQTRDTGDNGSLQLCPQCYELAGIENALLDAPDSYPENPSEERSAVWARYEEEIHDHLSALKGNGVAVETVWADLLNLKSRPTAPEPEPETKEAIVSQMQVAVAQRKKFIDVLEAEVALLNAQWQNAMDRATRTVADAAGRQVSTHLGHNLGNVAAELSTLAGKIESVQSMLAYVRQN